MRMSFPQYYSNNVVPNNMTARNHHGTPYPVDSEELRILQAPSFGPRSRGYRAPPPKISLQQAYQRLCTTVPRDTKTETAHKNLRDALKRRTLTWDLIIKMFDDLDTCYFHGDLRRRVYLCWKPFPPGDHDSLAQTHQPGLFTGNARVMITLRTNVKWEALPKTFALGTLVHEMVHAYFMINCGALGSLELGASDPHHGPVFMAAARKLGALTSLDTTSCWVDTAERESTRKMQRQYGFVNSSGYGWPVGAWYGM